MPSRRASRIGLYLGSLALFGACAWLFHLLRLNEAGDATSIRDRAGLTARANESTLDRAQLHAEADAIHASLDAFTRTVYRRHDDTQALLRDVRDRLARIEARLGAAPK